VVAQVLRLLARTDARRLLRALRRSGRRAVAGLYFLSRGASQQLSTEVADHFGWVNVLKAAFADIAGKGFAVWRAIPPLWFYGGVAALATAYATLIGVGAAAYRAYLAPRS